MPISFSPGGGCRDVRLGRGGANDVKTHAWFRNDAWTWDNIRQQVPPVVPELSSDIDTQYFDVIDDEKDKPDSFSTPRVSCCQCLVHVRERERETGRERERGREREKEGDQSIGQCHVMSCAI